VFVNTVHATFGHFRPTLDDFHAAREVAFWRPQVPQCEKKSPRRRRGGSVGRRPHHTRVKLDNEQMYYIFKQWLSKPILMTTHSKLSDFEAAKAWGELQTLVHAVANTMDDL